MMRLQAGYAEKARSIISSDFGDWPQADAFINEPDAAGADCAPEQYLETTPVRLPSAR